MNTNTVKHFNLISVSTVPGYGVNTNHNSNAFSPPPKRQDQTQTISHITTLKASIVSIPIACLENEQIFCPSLPQYDKGNS